MVKVIGNGVVKIDHDHVVNKVAVGNYERMGLKIQKIEEKGIEDHFEDV